MDLCPKAKAKAQGAGNVSCSGAREDCHSDAKSFGNLMGNWRLCWQFTTVPGTEDDGTCFYGHSLYLGVDRNSVCLRTGAGGTWVQNKDTLGGRTSRAGRWPKSQLRILNVVKGVSQAELGKLRT